MLREKEQAAPPGPHNPPLPGSITMSHAEKNGGYIPRNTIGFHDAGGKWGFLSNFKKSPFKDNLGRTWQTGEHYFQAGKAYLSRNGTQFEKIRNGSDPQEAKNLGNKIQIDVAEWNKISEDVMIDCIWYKVLCDRTFRLELLTTDDCLIVEMCNDIVWGSGLTMPQSAATPVKLWPGQNKLGEVWMYVRKMLQVMERKGVDLDSLKPEDFAEKKTIKKSSKIEDLNISSDFLDNKKLVQFGIKEEEGGDKDGANGDKDIVMPGALNIDHAMTRIGNSGIRSNSLFATYPSMNPKRQRGESQSLTEKLAKRLRVIDNNGTTTFSEDSVTPMKAQPMPNNRATCDENEVNRRSPCLEEDHPKL